MPIYDRPVKALMHDFAKERLSPNKIFEKKEAVDWFAKRYPEIKSNTVEMHVEGMAVNSPQRKHHPNIKPGSGHDLFYKIERGKFRLWNEDSDGTPFYKGQQTPNERISATISDPQTDEFEVEVGSSEFAFESDLRNYLAKNLNLIESGLKLFEDEGFEGVEFPVGGRFIDILAVDARGGYLVIELKVSRGYDRTVGQLLRYMAWIKQNLAGGKPVRGLIIAKEITEDLKLAVSIVSDVSLTEYELSMKLHAVTG